MRPLLFLLFFSAASVSRAQDYDTIPRQPLRFEMIPAAINYGWVNMVPQKASPSGAELIYNGNRQSAFRFGFVNVRALIRDRFVFGIGFSGMNIRLDEGAVQNSIKAANPDTFIEEKPDRSGYELVGGAFSFGMHFRLQRRWNFEALAHYELNHSKVPVRNYVFKDNQSNDFVKNRYHATPATVSGFGVELNLLRYDRAATYEGKGYYGFRLALSSNDIGRRATVEQADAAGTTVFYDYAFSKRVIYVSAGVFAGFHLRRPGSRIRI